MVPTSAKVGVLAIERAVLDWQNEKPDDRREQSEPGEAGSHLRDPTRRLLCQLLRSEQEDDCGVFSADRRGWLRLQFRRPVVPRAESHEPQFALAIEVDLAQTAVS